MYTIFTSCQYFISLYGEVQLPVLYSRQGKENGDIPEMIQDCAKMGFQEGLGLRHSLLAGDFALPDGLRIPTFALASKLAPLSWGTKKNRKILIFRFISAEREGL